MANATTEQAYFCCVHCGAEIEDDLPPLWSGLEFWPTCGDCKEPVWLIAPKSQSDEGQAS
jgi:hypothetical protein